MKKVKLNMQRTIKIPQQFLENFGNDFRGNCAVSPTKSWGYGRLGYDGKKHTAFLDLSYFYRNKRKWLPDREEEAKIKLKLDRGWNWIEIEYDKVNKEELDRFLQHLAHYINDKAFYDHHLWQKFNPSSRMS